MNDHPKQQPGPETGRKRTYCCSVWIATGLGLGFSPIAPGTVGGLWGIPLAWAISNLALAWQIPIILAICALGVPICTAATTALGKGKDPGSIVLDEIASLPITFFLVPMTNVWVILTGFVLHRIFDISKPPPARQLERLPDGLGIMADDWVAGLFSCICLHLIVALGWLPS